MLFLPLFSPSFQQIHKIYLFLGFTSLRICYVIPLYIPLMHRQENRCVFTRVDPTLENYWRGVILFGNNFATYKFALAHALYDIDRSNTFISLQDLALPFSQHICAHLKQAPKQILNTTNPRPTYYRLPEL